MRTSLSGLRTPSTVDTFLHIHSFIIDNTRKDACRGDPVEFLSKKYQAILKHQANKLTGVNAVNAKKLIQPTVDKLVGRHRVIDKTIFDKFRGNCPAKPGHRSPDEFCGSAKSIACFAAWGHKDSVFDLVHAKVVESVRQSYRRQSAEVRAVMVDGLEKFCPVNCMNDWIEPFQQIMLVWEQREHPKQYPTTPNCLPLGKGGI
ncbi:hypothetical protein BGZ96_003389 [Linnemannia gamsii]|uniref:Uncharacterized protein n=1 Tax=Linnemannia gamsii TaxID=64522 RepID=A0ABQ7K813_9FUNG|nr:hypothetical protein BGZ96_003389 [Linnemannia gamsii]